MTKDKQELAADVAVNVVSSGIVAFIVWTATGVAGQTALPTWAVVMLTSVSVVAVALIIALFTRAQHQRRLESDLRTATDAAATAGREVNSLRSAHQSFADNLKSDDVATVLKNRISYTVDTGGNDVIEARWRLAYQEDHQGRVFTSEDWGPEPSGEVTCSCDPSIGSARVVRVRDEPGRKDYVIHLHPPVGKVERQIEVRHVWPGLWNDLRKNGKDYVEVKARPGLQETELIIYLPLAMGDFEWETKSSSLVQLTTDKVGGQRELKMTIPRPKAGDTYRADLKRI